MINRFVYSLLLYLAWPLILGYFVKRMVKEPAYRLGFAQRFGLGLPRLVNQPVIHFHCASLGEAKAAVALIQTTLANLSEYQVVVTNTTPTGANEIKRVFANNVLQLMAPIDMPHITRLFAKRIQPVLSVFIEVELWPNWLASLDQLGTKILIANGRMTKKSQQSYANKSRLFAPLFKQISWVGAQSTIEATRLQSLGCQQVETTGNMKFDMPLPADLPTKTAELRAYISDKRPIFVAASVHPGEYEQVISAFTQVQSKVSNLLLVIIPRHPHRFQQVADYLQAEGIPFVRRSEQQAVLAEHQIWLADSMGEVMAFYQLADITFVGGSLVDVGGHNPLEPALLAKPILMGEYVVNCAESVAMLQENSAIVLVKQQSDIITQLLAWLDNPTQAKAVGLAAQQVVKANSGAVLSTFSRINALLSSQGL
ncbi:hypothetical protein C2869_10330 [Saccharobesus litoralis]|uniref:3-deoxy-D-manno-octulosonic acid transferase n=1 Tax=Saccharobesus litoralis TaxID=2172099 RepID=A0A2S0VRS5_9ALTE|nr:3-deoxy-D-manno-octulosonic acid transferase [Saccharobesus litoralis]AWB66800.1 hypothetical protein C2869_10330 [Saccharobesus litoralis]